MANRIAIATIVATVAFWAYTQTLLPGVDMGDTGGFQAAILTPGVSARQAYPLYYGLARPFVGAVSQANPARGLNLFSAICGGTAVGLLVMLGVSVTGSPVSGILAGLLLGFSYTFWTQAIIAEVYTLHLTLVLACCLALHGYGQHPTRLRLVLFFAIYALGFGNHFSMILLFLPFALFLLLSTPDRRTLFQPLTIALAFGIAAAAALQYWPNFTSTWHVPEGPATWAERVSAFWFDTTKSDWRETMVMGVRSEQTSSRLGMWWFDARQQFGVLGLAASAVGLWRLWTLSRPWAWLVTIGYAINTLFALTYNVGDTHVFYLPSHLFTALLAGIAFTSATDRFAWPQSRRSLVHAAAAVVLLYAGWRAWDTWPVVDRHEDRRAEAIVTRLSLGVSQQNAVLVTNLNWQLENALLYFTKAQRRDIAWVRLPEILPHFPFLVRDNEAISRDIVMDGTASREVIAAYGDVFAIQPDEILATPGLNDTLTGLPAGTPYVLSVLTPPREETLDPAVLASALGALTGAHRATLAGGAFQVIAGLKGEAPAFERSSDRPFREGFRVLDEDFTVRMESWLPTDTFRRAGFGHVLRGRERVQILERGVNLTWFDRNTQPSSLYAASLYAPVARYRISSVSPALARASQASVR